MKASILLVSTLVSISSLASAGDVTVRFVGLEEGSGEVRAALFVSAEAFEADERADAQLAPVRNGAAELVFTGVSPGTYGISAFLDTNANQELDRSFLGIPKEPYGFSNNARGRFGPPAFEAISFVVSDEPIVVEIALE